MKMKRKTKQNSFLHWLKNKGEHDYWSSGYMPDDYGKRRLASLQAQLKCRALKASMVIWQATKRCNLLCQHCGTDAGKSLEKELSGAEFLSQMEAFKAIGVKTIGITGGEPLMRKDLFNIIARLKENGFAVGLVTNGWAYDDSVFDQIQKLKLDSVNVSIDGLCDQHDLLRSRRGSFEHAMRFLSKVAKMTLPNVTVLTCVHHGNFNQLDELCETIFEAGVDSWVLRPVIAKGRAKNLNQLILKVNEYPLLINKAKQILEKGFDVMIAHDLGYLGKLDSVLRPAPYFPSFGWSFFHLLSNGDVKATDDEAVPVEGNIRIEALQDIWYEKFHSFRSREPKQQCLQCKYYGRCIGEVLPQGVLASSCLISEGLLI